MSKKNEDVHTHTLKCIQGQTILQIHPRKIAAYLIAEYHDSHL